MSVKIVNKELKSCVDTLSNYCSCNVDCAKKENRCIFKIYDDEFDCRIITSKTVEFWNLKNIEIESLEESQILDSAQYLSYYCAKQKKCNSCCFLDKEKKRCIISDIKDPSKWIKNIED